MENKDILKKWFGLDLEYEVKGIRYYYPYVSFIYECSLDKEELKKFCENEYFNLILAAGGDDNYLDLQFKIPPQYAEEHKEYKYVTEQKY